MIKTLFPRAILTRLEENRKVHFLTLAHRKKRLKLLRRAGSIHNAFRLYRIGRTKTMICTIIANAAYLVGGAQFGGSKGGDRQLAHPLRCEESGPKNSRVGAADTMVFL